MNQPVDSYRARAEECLAGARSELANGRFNNAANRAYYAAYNAAIIALIRAGVTRPRWLHEEVQALFAGQLVARRKLYPGDMRRTLSDLASASEATMGTILLARRRPKRSYGVPSASSDELQVFDNG